MVMNKLDEERLRFPFIMKIDALTFFFRVLKQRRNCLVQRVNAGSIQRIAFSLLCKKIGLKLFQAGII